MFRSVKQALEKCKEKQLADLAAAIFCLEELLAVNQDSRSRVAILNELGLVQTRAYNLEEAEKAFLELLEFSKKMSSDEGVIQGLLGLALIEVKHGHAQKTVDYALEALKLSKEINFLQGTARGHHLLAVGKWNSGDTLKAERHIEQAIFIWQETDNTRDLAESLNVAGGVLEAKGEREAALVAYNRALDILKSLGDPREMALVLNNIATAKKRLGAYDQAVDDYEQAFSLAREVADSHLAATISGYYAELLRERGEWEAARICYEEALRSRKSTTDLGGVAITLGDIGYLSYLHGDVQGAIYFFRESLRMFKKSGTHSGLVYRMQVFSRVLVDFGLISEAKEILEEAEELAERHKSISESAWVDLAWGYYEKTEDNIGRARTHLTNALGAARRISAPETVVLAAVLLAEIELEQGLSRADKESMKRAYRYIEEGKTITEDSGNFILFVDFLLIESLLLGAQFKFEEALEKVTAAKDISSRMHLAQVDRVRILESILRERRDLAESAKIMTILRTRSTRHLLDFLDLVVRRRPIETLATQEELSILVVKVGSPGPMVVFSDPLPREKDPVALSMSLGVFIATAIAQGGAHRSGLFGPLPVLDLVDHETLVYAASIPDRSQEDPRMSGLRYCIFFLIYPIRLRKLFWNLPAFSKVFEEHIQVSDLSEINAMKCKRLKEAVTQQLEI